MKPIIILLLLAISTLRPIQALAACGDGTVGVGEACDDNNLISGDGCSSTCAFERGYLCTGAPSVCSLLSTDMEYWCANPPSGASCIGSEPLQETESPVTRKPPNSVTKELCIGGGCDIGNNPSVWSYIEQTQKPATAITPLRALRGTGAVGASTIAYVDDIPLPTSGSACARHIAVWSSDSVNNEAGERKKIQDFYDIHINGVNQNRCQQIQTQWAVTPPGEIPTDNRYGLFMNQMVLDPCGGLQYSCKQGALTGQNIYLSECKGSNRCESQICIHGDFASGQNIWWEMFHSLIDANGQIAKTYKRVSIPCNLPGAVTLENKGYNDPQGANESNMVVNLFNGDNFYPPNCATADCGTATQYATIGWRDTNFAIFMTSTDKNFTIPLPVELVGAGSNTNSNPPPGAPGNLRVN